MNWSGGRSTMTKFLTAEVGRRMEVDYCKKLPHNDFLQWVIQTAGHVSQENIVRQVMIMTLGAIHQQPMLLAAVFHRLCLQPECVERLREEIKSTKGDEFKPQEKEMPYLDSFLKEVARLSPLTDFALPRKVISPFTFSDGTHVPTGNWVGTPHLQTMTDHEFYSNPHTFDGFRFVSEKDGTSRTRFTDVTPEYPFWGHSKSACPARAFVVLAVKICTIKLLEEYDFKAVDQNIPETLSYEGVRMPHPLLKIAIRKCNI
ncbi:cytochrome P450 [Halenospora varia]|nr:cytochrome P450 [Halenospora varia]